MAETTNRSTDQLPSRLKGNSVTLYESGPTSRVHKSSGGSTGTMIRARTPGAQWTGAPSNDVYNLSDEYKMHFYSLGNLSSGYYYGRKTGTRQGKNRSMGEGLNSTKAKTKSTAEISRIEIINEIKNVKFTQKEKRVVTNKDEKMEEVKKVIPNVCFEEPPEQIAGKTSPNSIDIKATNSSKIEGYEELEEMEDYPHELAELRPIAFKSQNHTSNRRHSTPFVLNTMTPATIQEPTKTRSLSFQSLRDNSKQEKTKSLSFQSLQSQPQETTVKPSSTRNISTAKSLKNISSDIVVVSKSMSLFSRPDQTKPGIPSLTEPSRRLSTPGNISTENIAHNTQSKILKSRSSFSIEKSSVHFLENSLEQKRHEFVSIQEFPHAGISSKSTNQRDFMSQTNLQTRNGRATQSTQLDNVKTSRKPSHERVWIPNGGTANPIKILTAREEYRQNSLKAKSIKSLDEAAIKHKSTKKKSENVEKVKDTVDVNALMDNLFQEKLKALRSSAPTKELINTAPSNPEHLEDLMRIEMAFYDNKILVLDKEEVKQIVWRFYLQSSVIKEHFPERIRNALAECFAYNKYEDIEKKFVREIDNLSRVEYCQQKASWKFLRCLIKACGDGGDLSRVIATVFGKVLIGSIPNVLANQLGIVDSKYTRDEIFEMFNGDFEGPLELESYLAKFILERFNDAFPKSVADKASTVQDIPFIKERLLNSL